MRVKFRDLFVREYYSYLFGDLEDFDNKLQVIICRLRRHPMGPVWNDCSGFEPDMSCKNCGDEL